MWSERHAVAFVWQKLVVLAEGFTEYLDFQYKLLYL